MSRAISVFRALSSGRLLMRINGLVVLSYLTLAVWSSDAFSHIIMLIGSAWWAKAISIAYLSLAWANLIRASGDRLRRAPIHEFAGWVILPLGCLIFLSGYYLSSAYRLEDKMLAGEGDILRPAWQHSPYEVVRIDSALKEETIDLKTDEGFGVFRYEPSVTVDTPWGERRVGAFPPSRIGGTYYHVLQFGLAPGLRATRGEATLVEGYMWQRILPIGSSDVFEIPGEPYKFRLRLSPFKTIKKGETEANVYNLVDPDYEVEALRDGKVIGRASTLDGPVVIEDIRLEFYRPTRWAMIEASRDPGLMVISLGLGLVTLGLLVWLLWMPVALIRAARRQGLDRT